MIERAIDWQVTAQDSEARAGVLRTRRGVIETPVFMPVGTLGTVKGVRFEALESAELDARIILANTYHLWLRPGAETVKACGGLHRFTGWQRALLTDSGGFQVWSLGELRKITEEGTEFRSHVDGNLCFLSPEISMEVQAALGSDIVMVFDECAPGKATSSEARRSMELTARWAQDTRPLDESCACSVCQRHSRAFLRHLNMSGEMLGSILLTHHNLAFFLDTMRRVRQAIRSGDFTRFRQQFIESLKSGV